MAISCLKVHLLWQPSDSVPRTLVNAVCASTARRKRKKGVWVELHSVAELTQFEMFEMRLVGLVAMSDPAWVGHSHRIPIATGG